MSKTTMTPSASAGENRPAGAAGARELYSRDMDKLSMPQSLRNTIRSMEKRERYKRRRWVRPAEGVAAAVVIACAAWGMGKLPQSRPQTAVSGNSASLSQEGCWPASSGTEREEKKSLSFPLVGKGAEDAARRYIPGYFTETPDSQALSLFLGGLPEAFPDWQMEALVGYSGEGEAVEMTAALTSSAFPGVSLRVESGTFRCYPRPEEGASESTLGEVQVVTGRYGAEEEGSTSFYATLSSLSDSGLSITVKGSSAGEEAAVLVDQMMQHIIAEALSGESRTGDMTLFTPTSIPQWRDDRLTVQQAREDSDFGSHLPAALPAGFAYDGEKPAHRLLGQNQNFLSVLAYSGGQSGYREISLRYGYADGSQTVLKEEDTELYDLTPYAIPWADTMPEQLRETLERPLFSAEGLTLEMVQKRCYSLDDRGDSDGVRCHFSIRFSDGVVVEIRTKGLAAEEVFQLIQEMGR